MKKISDSQDLYHFTSDWLSSHIHHWTRILEKFAHKPNLQFLEIGCFEGRATIWLLNNILTHETAHITCIDSFTWPNPEKTFDKNISEFKKKVTKIKGFSQEHLRILPLDTYDFIYVDGSHTASDTLEDAVLAFRLLKTDGIMIFDDYRWRKHLNPLQTPKLGIDAFLNVYKGQYDILVEEYQLIIKKRKIVHPRNEFPVNLLNYAIRSAKIYYTFMGTITKIKKRSRKIEIITDIKDKEIPPFFADNITKVILIKENKESVSTINTLKPGQYVNIVMLYDPLQDLWTTTQIRIEL